MQVSVPRDATALLAAWPALKEVLLVVPGDLASDQDIKKMRKRIWCLARRRGVVPISTTLAWQRGTNGDAKTAFRVQRCGPRTFSSLEQAHIFVAVKVNGTPRKQVAKKYGVPVSAVNRLLDELSQTA